MKLDLKKDRGILGAIKYSFADTTSSELSEDEQLVESLKRRHKVSKPEVEPTEEKATDEPKEVPKGKSNRNPLREFVIMVIMLAVTVYYMYDKGILYSTFDEVKYFVLDITGMTPVDTSSAFDQRIADEMIAAEGTLPEDVFNALMPVTPAIAALADSIASIPPESLYVDENQQYDTTYRATIVPVDPELFTPISDEPVELSDDDIIILNNRSLLLMVTEIMDNYPAEDGDGHLFLKRDALKIEAPRGGEWVSEIKNTLDKFVIGSFNEDYSTGSASITSKFEIIMSAEENFQPVILDEMRLLDVLAHPFTDFLKQIIIDLPRGVNDNPAKLTFEGSTQVIQYILSSWSESRSNYLIRSIDIDFQGDAHTITFGVVFFNYTP